MWCGVRVLNGDEISLRIAKVKGGQGIVSLGNYVAREPKTLADLPSQIRAKLERHLIERLGQSYYERLSFEGGQIVDFGELYRVDPSVRDFQWKIFAYRLIFRISEPPKGIEGYYATVELDKDGDVQTEIDLPKVRRFPEKAHFIALSSACDQVKRLGLIPSRARLVYNKEHGSIAFHFEQKVEDDGLMMKFWNIEVDAHSGEILRNYISDAIR